MVSVTVLYLRCSGVLTGVWNWAAYNELIFSGGLTRAELIRLCIAIVKYVAIRHTL